MYPILFEQTSFALPTYFAVISLAFVIGQVWLYRRAIARELPAGTALDLGLIMMLTGFLGGRLLHIFYEYPDYYAANWKRAFEIWHGGFVFFGGAFCASLATWIYARVRKLPWLEWADLFAPVMVFVYMWGRVANFLSGSCYGIPTNLPWAVVYPPGVEAPAGVPLHPAVLYECIWSGLTIFLLLFLEKRKFESRVLSSPGFRFELMLVLHGLGRVMLESFRGDFRGALIGGLSISTWISLVLVTIGLMALNTRRRIYY